MPTLHSFEENKLEYEDEDEVEIKMMGTGMDKESLEHNLYKNDITLSRKAHLLGDSKIPSIGVYDERRNRQDYRPTPKSLEDYMLTERGDGVTSIKRRRHDLRSDDVSTLVTPSEHG
ncbi:hypothetical protein Tco_0044385 [Tanacetum coccineum]